MRYIFGIIVAAIGVAIILKTEWIVENFGTSAWAEEHMGTSGGGRLLYKLIGLAIIFIGFLLITNLMGGFLTATVGRLFIR